MTSINVVSSERLSKLPPFNISEKSSGGPFDKAFDTLSKQMEHLSKEAQAYYDTLEQKTTLSKQATALLQNFDQAKAKAKAEDKAKAEAEAKAKAKAFLIEHDRSQDWSKVNDEQALREGLENFKTAQTDFVAESQLKIQRVMQTYNTTATLMNSLQSLLAELNKTIIQALR